MLPAAPKKTKAAAAAAGAGAAAAGFSLPKFELPSFSAPSISAPSVSLPGGANDTQQVLLDVALIMDQSFLCYAIKSNGK